MSCVINVLIYFHSFLYEVKEGSDNIVCMLFLFLIACHVIVPRLPDHDQSSLQNIFTKRSKSGNLQPQQQMPLFRALSQHCLCFTKSEPWQLHGWLSVVDEELVEVEGLDVVVEEVVGLDVVVEEVVGLDVVVENVVELDVVVEEVVGLDVVVEEVVELDVVVVELNVVVVGLDVVVEEVVVLDVVVGDVAEVVEGQITSSATQAPR